MLNATTGANKTTETKTGAWTGLECNSLKNYKQTAENMNLLSGIWVPPCKVHVPPIPPRLTLLYEKNTTTSNN